MKNEKQISNPYRAVGILHNEGLDYVIKNLNSKEPVTIDKIVELTAQYLQTVKNNSNKSDLALYYEFVATTINGLNQIPFQEFLREAKISKEGVCFINDIQNISPDFDFPTTLKVLTNIESNILTSK
jgi:ferritin-like protein